MRVVPTNRLLIQPTVQLKWLEQNGSIEFELERAVLNKFATLWSYLSSTQTAFKDFLTSAEAVEWSLHDDDVLFALLTGADYISGLHLSFISSCEQGRLVWSITR